MKRKIAKVLVAGLIGLQLIGCSNENKETAQNTETTQTAENTASMIYFDEIDVEGNVTLGEYKGVEVVSTAVGVSDEEVEAYIEYMMSMYSNLEEVTDRDVVENGDVVNIDYEGKKDGVAFEGGTSQGYDLAIGSGTFIPGFEEGLVGVKTGETVDLNLTFPEDYSSEDLAGAQVVFTVTVNGIYQETIPELNDEFVVQLAIEGVTTTEEYRVYMKTMMEESYGEQAKQDLEVQVITMVTENAQIKEVPQGLIDKFYDININNMTYTASMYGMDLNSFVSAYYGLDEEAFEAETVIAAEESAKQAMVCLKIAAQENITISEEEMNTAIEENYALYGYGSVEDFKSVVDLQEYKDSLLLTKIVNFLVENAVVTEVSELTAE